VAGRLQSSNVGIVTLLESLKFSAVSLQVVAELVYGGVLEPAGKCRGLSQRFVLTSGVGVCRMLVCWTELGSADGAFSIS
jgi:hypothetical protein